MKRAPGFYWVRVLHKIPSRWTQPTVGHYDAESNDWDLCGLNEPWPDDSRVQVLSERITPPSAASGKSELERRLAEADGLWRHWQHNDITADEDDWIAFSDAVQDHLDGKPVPERFVRSGP